MLQLFVVSRLFKFLGVGKSLLVHPIVALTSYVMMLRAPSFGYLLGFVAAAALVGRLAERGWDRTPPRTVLTMVLGNLVVYALGLPWLMAVVGVGLAKGLELGVTPFLAGDALKVLLAAGLLPGAWALVGREGPRQGVEGERPR